MGRNTSVFQSNGGNSCIQFRLSSGSFGKEVGSEVNDKCRISKIVWASLKMKYDMAKKSSWDFDVCREAKGFGELGPRTLWYECGQLQGCQRSSNGLIFHQFPEIMTAKSVEVV